MSETVNSYVTVAGVTCTIVLNKTNVWGNIIPVSSGPWSPIYDSQTSNWDIIDKAAT